MRLVKTILLLLTLSFIFYKLFYAYDIDSRVKNFQFSFSPRAWMLLAGVMLLMFVNWFLEISKWKLLVSRYENISFKESVVCVLSGVTLGIITPNQLGDFAGRVIHLKTLNKIKGSLVTVIGHTAQVLMTAIFGMYALLAFLVWSGMSFPVSPKLIATFFFVTHVAVVFAFLRLELVYNMLSKISWLHKAHSYIQVFREYTPEQLGRVFVLSFIRYVIFVLQYYLLISLYKVPVPFVQSMVCIAATFCVQSIVPSFILLDIGLRGASALMFFSNFAPGHETGILLAAYSLWIINIMIPALGGLWFILRLRIKAG